MLGRSRVMIENYDAQCPARPVCGDSAEGSVFGIFLRVYLFRAQYKRATPRTTGSASWLRPTRIGEQLYLKCVHFCRKYEVLNCSQ